MKAFQPVFYIFCFVIVSSNMLSAQISNCSNSTLIAEINGNVLVTADFLAGFGATAPMGTEIELIELGNPSNVINGVDEINLFVPQDIVFDYSIYDPVSQETCAAELYIFGDACVDSVYINFVDDVGIDKVIVDVELLTDANLQSLQWTLEYNPNLLSFSNIVSGELSVGLGNTSEFEPGYVNIVWINAINDPNYEAGSTLFSIEFDAIENGTGTVGILEGPYPGSIGTEAGNEDQEILCILSSPANVSSNGAKVEGTVVRYDDLSCSGSNPEPHKDWIISISNGTDEYFTSTDEDGAYKRIVVPGDYTITAYPYSVMWDFCENNIAVSLPNVGDQTNVDFISNAQLACSYLDVDLFTPFLRRCFENTYYLEYCNHGTAIAENAYIEVELDEHLTILSADAPYTQVGQLVTFELGTVDLECGWISFEAELSCDAELGETHCTTATIYPQDPCAQALEGWDGPVIEVSAICDGDSIRFTVANTGLDNMITSAEFIVVEDDVMTEIGNFQLNALESAEYNYPAEGATLRFNASQSIGFPYDEFATAYVEGCGTNDNGEISVGFINNFSLGDYLPFVDIDCQQNIGSFDPNDKVSFPEGYGEEHFIKRDQTIDYKIRFQNTGTDTAFRVVVVDTLSEFLDIRTFKRTAFSHNNTMSIEDRVVTFTFNDIQLVDSTANESASHGFVSFQIDMNEGLQDGTIINNDANIYFDFNEPITTNETFLEIGTDFINDASLSTIDNPENILVQIVPNPANESSTIYFNEVNTDDMKIEIYNVVGKLLHEGIVRNHQFDLAERGLSKGTYLIKLIDEKRKVFSGKLIVH